MAGSATPDRIMWFSMWFLASIVTFGLAFFPMFYRSVERRNQHFKRQHEMEKKVLRFVNDQKTEEVCENLPLERNATLLAVSIVFVVPTFAVMYLLSGDLVVHEKNQQTFLKKILPGSDYKPQKIWPWTYLLITVATLGVGGIYWLYKVLEIYNNHFREHRTIDEDLGRLVEASSHGNSV